MLLFFYKENFIYDDELINAAKTYSNEIKKRCTLKEKCGVYCGVKVGKPGEIWPPDLFIGFCENKNKKQLNSNNCFFSGVKHIFKYFFCFIYIFLFTNFRPKVS